MFRNLIFSLWARVALGLVIAAIAPASMAQQNVRLVVNFAAGSSTDVLARQLVESLREVNGNQYLIDNKPGASGLIGSSEVAKAKPDGSVLLMTTGGHSTNAALFDKLPYDTLQDFTPISQLNVGIGFLLMVPASSPYKSFDQLLAAARANPGKLSYGSAGNGNTTHLAGALFERAAGIKLIHVPYKGTPMNDLLAGHIDMLFWGTGFATPIVQGGKARALAVTSEKRLEELPDVPTLSEKGIHGLDVPAWSGIFGPGKMAPELANKIQHDIALAMQRPAFLAAAKSPGSTAVVSTPVQFRDYLRAEIPRLRKDLAPLGIRMD